MKCEKCESEKLKSVKYKISNGNIQIRKQCLECGYLNTHNYKFSNFSNEEIEQMSFVNEELREQYYENQKNIREQKRLELETEYLKHRQEGFEKLNEYYNSQEWENKRILRLRLNKFLFDGWCERCGKQKATQVHHRSYEYINGYEHPFDLEALCEDCHKMLHPHMEE